jgi:streptogramin lyase
VTTSGSFTLFPLTSGSPCLPEGITVGPNGNLWFTENFSNAIGEITTSGQEKVFPLSTANGYPGPTGITTGPDGNLWFTESGTSQIARITPSGQVTQYPTPTPGSDPTAITSADCYIWFTESANSANNIGRLDPATGQITEYPIPTGDSHALGIAPRPNGTIWFTENTLFANHVGELDPATGRIVEFSLPIGGDPQPLGITEGPDGNMWFTLQNGSAVGVIGTNTVSTGTVDGQIVDASRSDSPIAGASVSFCPQVGSGLNAPCTSATSDRSGDYEVAGLKPGRWLIQVQAPEQDLLVGSAVLDVVGGSQTQNFALRRPVAPPSDVERRRRRRHRRRDPRRQLGSAVLLHRYAGSAHPRHARAARLHDLRRRGVHRRGLSARPGDPVRRAL